LNELFVLEGTMKKDWHDRIFYKLGREKKKAQANFYEIVFLV